MSRHERQDQKERQRFQGEGSITKLTDGTWCASITIGYDTNGPQRFKTRICQTQQTAQDALVDAARPRSWALYDDRNRSGKVDGRAVSAQLASAGEVSSYPT